MFRKYGYIGLLLIIFAEINFFLKIEPFATWYVPIVWYGLILFVDALVYKIKKKSLLTAYPKELLAMICISVPFWLIFEWYNLVTVSWVYFNFVWYVHLVDFTTIMPAGLEIYTLLNALNIGKSLDKIKSNIKKRSMSLPIALFLLIFGGILAISPFILPNVGFFTMWIGLFLLIDPINYMLGNTSVVANFANGKKSMTVQLLLMGLVYGLFLEFWNSQAIPQWQYNLPLLSGANPYLFTMPIAGYVGYMPFGIEIFVFYVLVRKYLFKGKNELLTIS